ncbi:AraC family transcriptional regulator [Roseateles cellulosilyticus]|uniref:AraC family transcriptional regulator n=1 Tax=Pelomonas cellulosilytica TaxID=2906762 RepID=A0ABS8XNF0_9BURK|nr:AraC family transcriptional regulator [Pelomonas sp. P8]MCE4553280.1 AraC family transcriptional regulator [Pelomonas sp. P8]
MLPSHVDGVDIVVADSARAFGRHTHDQFGIGRIERGAQKSASGRGTVEAGPGDLITVNPGEIHDGRPVDATGRRWRMLYIEPHRLLDAARDLQPAAEFEFTAPVLRDPAFGAAFHALFAAVTRGNGGTLEAEAALLALVAQHLGPASSDRPAAVPRVVRARERMDDDPAAALTLAALAAEVGMSRHQFLRAFTRLTGLPPHAYQLQRRVQLARRLILQGLGLAECAAASGFADQSHMTRCFVRQLGLTPGALARR